VLALTNPRIKADVEHMLLKKHEYVVYALIAELYNNLAGALKYMLIDKSILIDRA
jgi:hypothetical protein